MKTKYKFIHFYEVVDGEWVCFTNSKPLKGLGVCEYYAPWKQWQFVPSMDTAFTSDCCRDIAHFLDQLPNTEVMRGQIEKGTP
jgi:hypothetical protein